MQESILGYLVKSGVAVFDQEGTKQRQYYFCVLTDLKSLAAVQLISTVHVQSLAHLPVANDAGSAWHESSRPLTFILSSQTPIFPCCWHAAGPGVCVFMAECVYRFYRLALIVSRYSHQVAWALRLRKVQGR